VRRPTVGGSAEYSPELSVEIDDVASLRPGETEPTIEPASIVSLGPVKDTDCEHHHVEEILTVTLIWN
jgi:hypothetical protein